MSMYMYWPIYILRYHLVCVMLVAVPEGPWFCDEDCHGNAWFRWRGVKKIRERAHVIEWVHCIVTIVTIKNLTTVIVETMFFFNVYMCQKSSHGMYVEIMVDFSFLGLPVMAEGGGGRGWRVLNPDFRPCVGDSGHRYLLCLIKHFFA